MTGAIVIPDVDLGEEGAGCVPSESKGDVQIIHECAKHPGEYKKTTSEGPIEWIAPLHLCTSGSAQYAIKDGLVLIEVDGTTVSISPDHVVVSIGDAEIEACTDRVSVSVGPASTEITSDHVVVSLGACRIETTAEQIDAAIGDTTSVRATDQLISLISTAPESHVRAQATAVTLEVLLPAAEGIAAHRYVSLIGAGVICASPASEHIIGATTAAANRGERVPVALLAPSIEVEAAAEIGRCEQIEIDDAGRARPFSPGSGAPVRGFALSHAAAGERVLIMHIEYAS